VPNFIEVGQPCKNSSEGAPPLKDDASKVMTNHKMTLGLLCSTVVSCFCFRCFSCASLQAMSLKRCKLSSFFYIYSP